MNWRRQVARRNRMLYQRESATRLFGPNHKPHAAGAQIDKLAIGRPDDARALGDIKSLHPPLPFRVANSMSTDERVKQLWRWFRVCVGKLGRSDLPTQLSLLQIGRASCRERVEIAVVWESL